MRKSRRQRGESNAGCLFGLIVLAVVAYFAYKMIPAKIKAADLKQTITDEAKMCACRQARSCAAQSDSGIRELLQCLRGNR